MNVAIGSCNAAKVKAVESVLKTRGYQATIIQIDAPSNVSNMPFSDEETMQGALNRAAYCLEKADIDIAFGLEGGVTETPFGLFLCNWGVVAVKGQAPILAGGARIKLPEEIAERLRSGAELGPVMVEYSSRENVRSKEGAIGIFTNGAIERADMFMHITKMLLGQLEAKRL